MIKIVGIDPGLASTGIGIVKGSALKAYEFAYGSIRTYKKDALPSRLEVIYTKLERLLKDEAPDLLVIEDVFSLEKYPKSGIILGKVCGVIILAGIKAGIDTREIPVREAKKVLTGNGGASKGQLEKAVRAALGKPEPIRPFHASDALGLALIGLFRYGSSHRSNRRSGIS
jgi:crossover junction endodeoxyribonuclease RuvC